MAQWRELATKHKFRIIHQTANPNVKNSSDMRLIMDAMEILYRISTIEAFCIVSNDADYVPLCDKLHEEKKGVIGAGYKHASEVLIRACDQFIFIGDPKVVMQPTVFETMDEILPAPVKRATPVKPPPPLKLPDMKKILPVVFAQAIQNKQQQVTLSAFGSALRVVMPGFEPKLYGFNTLSLLLKSLPDLVKITTTDNKQVVTLIQATVASPASKGAAKKVVNKTPALKKLLSQAFSTAVQDANRWVTLPNLSLAIRAIEPDFKPGHYGRATYKIASKSARSGGNQRQRVYLLRPFEKVSIYP